MFYLKIGTHAATLEKFTFFGGLTIGFLFGGWNQFLTALLVIQALDVITGLLAAGKDKNISSHLFGIGIKKKVGSWIALILAHVIDMVLFEGQGVAITGVTFAFISGEGISLVENLGNMGVNLPPYITNYLVQIRSKSDNAEYTTDKVPVAPVEEVLIVQDGEVQKLEVKENKEE